MYAPAPEETIENLRALFVHLHREDRHEELRAAAHEALRWARGDDWLAVMSNLGLANCELGRHFDALAVYMLAAPAAEVSANKLYKAKRSNGLGVTYQRLAEATGDDAYVALAEGAYLDALYEYEGAGMNRFRGGVWNNLAFLMIFAGRAREAHPYLDHARAVFEQEGEPARCAEVDDTRARAFMQEGRWLEALAAAARALATLEPMKENGEREAYDTAAETHARALEECRRRGLVR